MNMQPLYDYLYLDSSKLVDYMSALDQGVLRELRETTSNEDGEEMERFLNDPPSESKAKSTQEKVLSASERTSFRRLRAAIASSIQIFDEDTDIDIASIEKRSMVEVTRDFEPSPVSQMMDSMIEFTQMAQKMGVVGDDAEAQQAIHGMTLLFRGDPNEQKEVPVVSASSGAFATSIFYMAKRQYMLRGTEDLEGESTLIGRVEKMIPPGQVLDLFDALRLLPRNLRRSSAGKDMKSGLKELFRTWPHEFGGPIVEEAFELKGPLLVISPLAVYK